jgi:hypothetical protein
MEDTANAPNARAATAPDSASLSFDIPFSFEKSLPACGRDPRRDGKQEARAG